MQPKVSLIVPVYRVPEKFLRKCIESCQEQTMKEIEIILVHDHADDNCGDICDEYARKDSRIKVIHKKGKTNSGLSAARNSGVDAACGEWITFIDGDDWIEPETCNTLYETGVKENVGLVMCGVCKDYGTRVENYKYTYGDYDILDIDMCKDMQAKILDFNGNISGVFAKLISREYLAANEIYHDEELKCGVEGLEFNIRMMEHIERAVFVKRYFYHYMYNDVSLSANVSDRTNDLIILGFTKIKSFIDHKSGNKEKMETRYFDRIHYAVITAAISGYYHPDNEGTFHERTRRFEGFLDKPVISSALKHKHCEKMSKPRVLALWCINHKLFFVLSIMAKLRYKQRHR